MSIRNDPVSTTSDREIVIERVFNAPQEIVFKAWTTPENLGKWWGPNGFTTTTHEMDFKPGGVWRFMMHGPDDTDFPNIVRYKEIEPPHRITYAQGNDIDPEMFEATITFTPQEGNNTHLQLKTVFHSAEVCEEVKTKYGAVEGGHQTLGRLAEYLEQQ